MYKKIVWPLLVIMSLGLIVMFSVGFGISVTISSNKDANNELVSEVEKNESVGKEDSLKNQESNNNTSEMPNILVIGDSIGYGFGDDGNSGIGNRYGNLLGINTEENPVNNISVSGDEVLDLEVIVNNNENEAIIADMDLIIISIGGNDLNRIEYEDTVDLEINYRDTLKSYKKSLNIILNRIRELNPEVQLALVGLYDPFANNEQKTKLLLNWNYETRLLIHDTYKVVYIPTYEGFQYNLEEYLAFDKFHPSPLGYQFIAEELYKIINGQKINEPIS